MKLNQKVLLRKSYAKWFLDNPEIYVRPDGTWDEDYENDTLMHLMCCMDIPVQGRIMEVNSFMYEPPTYLVAFKVGRLKMSYWVDRSHIVSVR
jgi:hypothetical protein